MKRTLLLAALAATATTSVFAQSNVTIYGRMNVTVERLKFSDQDSATEMRNNSSRIGFYGAEDLGDGLKAIFALEYGTDPTQTSAAALSNRHSWVGLEGAWGKLRGGRMTSEAYYATADYISMHNHDTGTSADTLYDYVSSNDNKIAYRTPDFGGFSAEWQHSVGEETAHTNDVAMYYKAGPIDLGAGYAKINGANWLAAIRALYATGPFVFGAYYERDGGDFENGESAKRNNIRLAGRYTVGANEFHVNVGRAGDRGGEDDTGALQWTLGYNYNLSKRTKVYGYYTRVSNESGASYFSGRDGVDFNSLAAGIRHHF